MNNDSSESTATIEVIYFDGTTRQITYPLDYFPYNLKLWQDRFFAGTIAGW